MTTLPTPQALADANIDSLERLAIALGLFFAQKTAILPDSSPSKEAITFSIRERAGTDPENPDATLITSTIEFKCFFKLQADAALEGGILLENIEPFFTLDTPTFPESPPSLLTAPALPTIPDLDNAEQLMVWALLTLNASTYPENQDFIQISPAYLDNELGIDFQFPLDSQALSLNSYQYIAASKRIVNDYLALDSGAIAQIGLDAYQVAVSEGYLGTRAEWLLTLIGPKGDKGEKGDIGTAGAGVSWQGIWNSGTTYAKDDAVDYQGSSYIANAITTNEIPGVSAKWDLWVAKGEPGQDGATGPAGPQGEPGQDGATGPAGSLSGAGAITLDLVAEPATPAPDKLVVWASALDGLIYKKDQAGIVEAIGTGGSSPGGGREVLTGDRTYFVRTDGNDSNNGLNNTAGGAFATIQKFIDTAASLDLSIYNVIGQLGAGIYSFTSTDPLILKSILGAGKVILRGNSSDPSTVKIKGSGAFSYEPVILGSGIGFYEFDGINFDGGGSGNQYDFNLISPITVTIKNCLFSGGTYYTRINAEGKSQAFLESNTINSGAYSFLYVFGTGTEVRFSPTKTTTIIGTPTFNFFARIEVLSQVIVPAAHSFSGGINGAKYFAEKNAVGYGVNAFPGSPGSFSTGGVVS